MLHICFTLLTKNACRFSNISAISQFSFADLLCWSVINTYYFLLF